MKTDYSTEHLRSVVSRIWAETDRAVDTILDRGKIDPPRQVVIREGTERIGGSLDGEILYLNKEAITEEFILQGVIIREYMMATLPKRITPHVQKMIGNSVAIYFQRGTKREQWREKVGTSMFEMKFSTPRGGAGHEDWQFHCFWRILVEVIEAAECGITIGLDEYRRIVHRISERCTPCLDADEVSLLRRIVKSPPSPYSKIADELNKSIQWVSKKIKELEEIEVLQRYTTLNPHIIGIREFTVINTVNERDHLRPVVDMLSEFPFTYKIEECSLSRRCLIASLRAPDTRTSVQAIKLLVEDLSSLGETRLHEHIALGHSEKLKFYDVDEGIWRIPWDIAEIEFNRIYHESLATVMPKIEADMTPTSKYLTRFDLQVLQSVLEGATRITDIRQALRVGQAKVATSYKLLRDEGIISNAVELFRIGLNECVAILTEDPKVADSITAWSQTLPKVGVRRWLKGGMEMRLQLPQGGTLGVLEALNEVLPDINTFTIRTRTVKQFVIPVEEWDEDQQRWENNSRRIEEWINTHQ
ncbi:MAG: Lrp/AsnC family transcriptional regulator [Candidatus Thorarchaeota archaeon]|nr:Lrp/AsnC family transcriptional regulator [Candidatus Thorarchaeota archaeon]